MYCYVDGTHAYVLHGNAIIMCETVATDDRDGKQLEQFELWVYESMSQGQGEHEVNRK
jgi:hypothetical protein